MNAISIRSRVLSRAFVPLCLLGSLGLLGSLAIAIEPAAPTVKIAVFDFELEDLSAASVILGQSTTGSDSLHKVGEAARKELAKSGRYVVIDPSRDGAEFSKDKALKDCGGCEAALASRLRGAQSPIGPVRGGGSARLAARSRSIADRARAEGKPDRLLRDRASSRRALGKSDRTRSGKLC